MTSRRTKCRKTSKMVLIQVVVYVQETGVFLKIKCTLDWTIAELKLVLQELNVCITNHQIVYAGSAMPDSSKLFEHGLVAGSTVHVVNTLSGDGKIPKRSIRSKRTIRSPSSDVLGMSEVDLLAFEAMPKADLIQSARVAGVATHGTKHDIAVRS